MSKKKKKETSALRGEVETNNLQGVPLWLEGRPSTPKEIVKACHVAEAGVGIDAGLCTERQGEWCAFLFDKIGT